MERRPINDMIMAVGIAIVAWFYVMSVVNPPTTATIRSVPVTLLNEQYLESSKLAIAGDGKYTVDVSISGKRTDLMISASDLTATADLNGLTPGQNYITVKVTSPHNTTVEEIRTEKIQVYVDEFVSEDKAVSVAPFGVKDGCELAGESLSVDSIKVSGAKSLVERVAGIRLECDVSGFNVDEEKTVQLTAVPVDAEGGAVSGVRLGTSYVNYTATLYTVKTVPLYTRVDGEPGMGVELISANIPSSVSIKGSLLKLSQISSVGAEPLSIEGLTSSAELSVTPILEEGIELAASGGPLTATFTMSDTGAVTLYIPGAQIALEGLPEEFIAEVPEGPLDVSLIVRGAISDISELTAEDIVLFSDLSGISEPGEYEAAISARAADGRDITAEASPDAFGITVAPAVQEEP